MADLEREEAAEKAIQHEFTLHVDQPKASSLWMTCSCGWTGANWTVTPGNEAEFDRAREAAYTRAQGHVIERLTVQLEAAEADATARLEARYRDLVEAAKLHCRPDFRVGPIEPLRAALAALESSSSSPPKGEPR